MAGICDDEQVVCLALALWNGQDPILKESALRAYELSGQPRRRCEGMLVVPRRDADFELAPVALPLPSSQVPL